MSLELKMNTQTKLANPKHTLEIKQDAAKVMKMEQSTSREGNCWDTPAERFIP